LTQYEEELKVRGQCKLSRDGASEGQHHWLELDNNPTSEFLSLFDKDRIILPIIKKTHGFSFVKGGSCSNDKTNFFLSPDALFLVAIMNSSITEWIARMQFPGHGDPWAGGRIEYRAGKVKGLPIPPSDDRDKSTLTTLAERAADLAVKGDQGELNEVERQIDSIVYRLFDLSAHEIAQIEGSLATTRSANTDDASDDDKEDA
jgi:hypothetical protein